SRRRHTRSKRDWSSDVCSSDLSFRAGFLAAHSWGLPLERAVQVGNATAVHCLEADGPQEYSLTSASLLARIERSYGAEAAEEVQIGRASCRESEESAGSGDLGG